MKQKGENGMANETGKPDFPQKQFETVLLHSLRVMDQNREYLQMHLARSCDEKTRQALEDMGQESIRMERTLREMMELLAAERGPTPPMKPVDLCWVLLEIREMAPEIRRQVRTELTVDRGGMDRCYIRADQEQTEQLLFHLLSNALQATSPGGHVEFRLSSDETDLHLVVEDDGCGLPTADNWMENRRRFLGGAQAGLLLCRRYCANMGWELTLNLRSPRGTRAELLIPKVRTMFPIEGTVELRATRPELAGGSLQWQLRRELSLLSCRTKE